MTVKGLLNRQILLPEFFGPDPTQGVEHDREVVMIKNYTERIPHFTDRALRALVDGEFKFY